MKYNFVYFSQELEIAIKKIKEDLEKFIFK